MADDYDVPEIDPGTLDLSTVVADIDVIRQYNPHRHEFEMLSAITQIDRGAKRIIGYKDCAADDFWARGHLPDFPLLPGVLMCEAAAQLCAFYGSYLKITNTHLTGLAGIEMAKFRRIVQPGERLILVGHGLRTDRRLMRFHVRGYVGAELAFETVVVGVPLKAAG